VTKLVNQPIAESDLPVIRGTPLLKSPRSKGPLFEIKTAVSKMRSSIKYASAFRTEQVGPAGGITTLILRSRRICLF
jgi:hypothetical protein